MKSITAIGCYLWLSMSLSWVAAQELKSRTTLIGHTGCIQALVFSPDGKNIASGSIGDYEQLDRWDHSIKLWDVATGKNTSSLDCNPDVEAISSLSYSPDGKTLASGYYRNNNITIWNIATAKRIATLKGHAKGVNSLVYSPNGKTLASGSIDNTIKLWDVSTGNNIASIGAHRDGEAVLCISFSPDGKTLASGGTDGNVMLWDVASRKNLSVFTGHSSLVRSVKYSPDGQTMASACLDDTTRIWDIAGKKTIAVLPGGSLDISYNPDGKTVAVACGDTIMFWDTTTWRKISEITRGKSWKALDVVRVAYSPNGKNIVSGHLDGSIILWESVFSEKEEKGKKSDSHQIRRE